MTRSVVSSGFPTGIARGDGGFGGAHGGSFCFSEALAWVGRRQEEVGDGLGGERRFGIRVGLKRGQVGENQYRFDENLIRSGQDLIRFCQNLIWFCQDLIRFCRNLIWFCQDLIRFR